MPGDIISSTHDEPVLVLSVLVNKGYYTIWYASNSGNVYGWIVREEYEQFKRVCG